MRKLLDSTMENGTTLLFLFVSNNNDVPDAPEAVFARLEAIQHAFPGSRTLLLPELTPTRGTGGSALADGVAAPGLSRLADLDAG